MDTLWNHLSFTVFWAISIVIWLAPAKSTVFNVGLERESLSKK